MRILVLFISSVLIYGLLAPLFRRMRATFSQFGMKLIFSPQSGKTFNDNSTKRNPLSALTRHSPRRGKLFIPAFACHSPRRGKQLSVQCATLPEGESFYPGICVPLSPKGKAVIDTAYHSPRKKKRFPPSGKTFYFPTQLLLLSAEREDFFSSTQSKRAGRLSII